ncbi:MAG TPA: lytic transglycosylase domain-containing protein [Bryobacteraceae bacterium]|jgi:soluble lytic murein transglycosylase-like protein|nr:lytic transglycosylase domain-containing protein [Bryobacteraceae bacterium]
MRVAALFLCLAAPAFAGEFAVLASGARLHADRHEAEDGKVRLYTGTGFVEIDAAQIAGFEPDGAAPAPHPAATSASAASAKPQPAPARTAGELADAAADRYGLPRKLVRSVMGAESAGNARAVSPKGALGLMQLMPATAKQLGANPLDPAQNVDAGVRYLRDLLILYDGRLWHALAAYNAGPGAVQKHNGNIPPYRETLDYIHRVTRGAGY